MPDRRSAQRYSVVVIGGGPTGLTLANLLSRYGAHALLVERNEMTVQEPRAVSIDDESLRTMQAAGVIGTVLPGIVAGYGSEYLTPGGRTFLKVEPREQPYGYPRRNAFRQPRLEAQLREALDESPCVDTLFGWTLFGFAQRGDGVDVDLVDAKGMRRAVRCDYLVGADGARSEVRTALGLSLDGETFQEKWLIVDLEDSPTTSKETIVYCDARRPCIALPGPDRTRRFEFKLLDGEEPEVMVQEATVAALLSSHGVHPASRVNRKTVYTFHARLAPTWSLGRVFLAGDACHLTPPFAGQGMNSGIRDAHNLAWKLAWVTSGRASQCLLETYESERRDHVREMIRLALRMGRIMGPRNKVMGHLTQTLFRVMGLWPRCRDYFSQMKYKPKPRFTSGLILPDKQGTRHTLVGRLLPQPMVIREDGSSSLLDDVLGDGFALITFRAPPGSIVELAGSPALDSLAPKILVVKSEGALGELPDGIEAVFDPAGVLLEAAGGSEDRVLLVRPDRYVLTTFRIGEENRLAQRLAELLDQAPREAGTATARQDPDGWGQAPPTPG
ncbi:bifunctional 3-(3-hydroxy-phenyl)propionate/3-hydroxycinnamic acid hydroxylase [Novosphingobium resinovorum]|uniref:bifunctional 3-(3-hydroxy-phenyl)propionate/3-hydroxycinnamic acid hydroxylase n=1 Tax=Novosphingobium resinovorum TaxID=158500 RepID=UPI002ED12C5D|nr:bifunctional 3-(3-hydroxy-phenyl)propionate/3-hydroxycinnamic acid hydroxylase [Novosphingobium resinovorum]